MALLEAALWAVCVDTACDLVLYWVIVEREPHRGICALYSQNKTFRVTLV